MNLVNKLICLLFYCLLVTEGFAQEQSYNSGNGKTFLTRNIYMMSNLSTPSKRNNSFNILDSLVIIYENDSRTRITYTYNNDLSLNYFTNAIWYNGEWINSGKHTNTYNSDGNLELVLWEWFNTSSEEWLKDAKDVYNYDSLGNRINYLHQVYNGQEIINKFRYEYCYNTTNNVISSLRESWNNGKWVNASKTSNTYSSANLKDTTLMQYWENDQWVNYQLNIYEYDEKLNIISNLAKRWQDNDWLNVGMGSFEYDVNNNCVLENWEIASNNNWENWSRIFYEYDDNNNLIHLFGEEWKNGQWVPENEPLKVTNPDGILFGYLAKEIFLYYSKPTSVEIEKIIADGFNLLQNYPNPFNPSTVISYNIPEHSLVTLNIYNLLGEKIKTLVKQEQTPGKYQIKFDGNNFPSGIYFYQLKTDKFQQTKKMLLLR
ncbi:MAG: T9SS type A sorting domain-containing protein [Ignavibacteria bacterium]|jgi:hypothetical protein